MIDTTNKFLVSVQGNYILILNTRSRMSPDEALNLAAYLVVMSGPFAAAKFAEVLEAVQNA